MATPITQEYLLLGEGKDEEYFFASLVNYLNMPNIQVLGIAGKTQLGANLQALRKAPDFNRVRCLAVTRDADQDPQGAFQSVCDALEQAELPRPSNQMQPTGSAPCVLVLILPRPGQAGALEDLCLESLAESPATECVEEYIECLKDNACLECNSESKASVHTFLASRRNPEWRLGEAACGGCWDFDHEAFAQLRDFLAALVS